MKTIFVVQSLGWWDIPIIQKFCIKSVTKDNYIVFIYGQDGPTQRIAKEKGFEDLEKAKNYWFVKKEKNFLKVKETYLRFQEASNPKIRITAYD